MNFIGAFECKSDTKGRVMIPSLLKDQFAKSGTFSFIIKRSVFQNCLELYPIKHWENMVKKMSSLNRFRKKTNDFIRIFSAGVKLVEVDVAGRLLIPKNLIEFAGMSKDIVLSSSIDFIEIWDKSKYEKLIESSTDEFSTLAEEVMGKSDE